MTTFVAAWLFPGLYRSPVAYRAVSELGFAGYWRVWQRLSLRYVPKGLLLDLGCGMGDLTFEAAKAGWNAVGVDLSRPLLESTHRRRGGDLRPCFAECDARALPFLSSTIDAVTVTFPSDVVCSPRVALELHRILKPEGAVAIVLGATPRPTTAVRFALLMAQRVVYGRSAGVIPRTPPPLPFESAGFDQRYVVIERSNWAAWLVVLAKHR